MAVSNGFKPHRVLRPWSRVGDDVVVYELGPEVRSGDRSLLSCCRLNSTAAEIWSLCDGKRRVDEIISIVAERYGIEPEQADTDVKEVLQGLSAAGFVELNHETFF